MAINTELAKDIRTVIEMMPNMHDQENWFYVYEGADKDRLTPEDVHIEQLLAEVKESEAKGETYATFEPTVSCEATLCVAGWACIMNGYELMQDEEDQEIYAVKNGTRTEVFDKGQELLGIDTQVADWLFCSTSDSTAIHALSDMAEGHVPAGFLERFDDDYCCEGCSDNDYDY